MSSNPTPTTINLQKKSRLLAIEFDDGNKFDFSFEFLRVHSPSAEVRGHGQGDAVLQIGKEDVIIDQIEPVGNYAVKLIFNDGHDSGLYSWDYFYEMGENKDTLWQHYLEALKEAGHERQANGG